MPFIRRKRKNSKSVSNNASNAANNNPKVQTKKRIAIIGSGVSGLTCAHYLVGQHDVTVFEANDYIGGHVNTINVALQDSKKSKSGNTENSAIDTGFIVFNERTYPNFFRLLYDLKVPFQSTDMSFSVKNTASNFEYNGHTLNTLNFGSLLKIFYSLINTSSSCVRITILPVQKERTLAVLLSKHLAVI